MLLTGNCVKILKFPNVIGEDQGPFKAHPKELTQHLINLSFFRGEHIPSELSKGPTSR